jgi:hypothetical protein
MPTTTNQIIITYWVIRPAQDLHTTKQMREAGESGVYEPTFTTGEKHLLCMVARFDKSDFNARMTAALYAMKNAKLLELHPGHSIWGVECWMDGEKLSSDQIPQ